MTAATFLNHRFNFSCFFVKHFTFIFQGIGYGLSVKTKTMF
ncbi:hypothetical protein HMPREF0208_04364 [Citrobacter koseri]|nr:hypothetical protein HMPREF3220_04855 [Citrobacter koseri]KWZ98415.1 hypothetical protein HMPREF3207_04275 [Citrobacter koseri]KXB40492.1 hypothetical protein HMPREF0208_04364 [Citrobacter koseri]